MYCKKCDALKTVTLRQKDHYCDLCFMTSTNHKFRACLGKNKVLSPNENVLIGLSGGPASTVLLDLIHYGLSLENNKKLRIIPHFIHLYDDNKHNCALAVLEQCKQYNSQCYFAHISDFMKTDILLPGPNSIPQKDENISNQFKEMLCSLSATSAEDFMSKVKRNLFIKFARKMNCNVVFTAEITNILAMNLLSNIVLGRGSQVQNDVGFSDIRDEAVKILRPMRDINKEELNYYIAIRNIGPILPEVDRLHNLQSTIRLFVDDLQENFQSTISTVCKTADKIGFQEQHNTLKCAICESVIKAKDFKLSALEATNFSRTVSFGQSQQKINNTHVNNDDMSMFPHIHEHLCYTCSRNYLETDNSKLPQHIQNLLP